LAEFSAVREMTSILLLGGRSWPLVKLLVRGFVTTVDRNFPLIYRAIYALNNSFIFTGQPTLLTTPTILLEMSSSGRRGTWTKK